MGVSLLLCAKQGICPSAKARIPKPILSAYLVQDFDMEVISCPHLRPAFSESLNLCGAARAVFPVALRFGRKKPSESPSAYHWFVWGVFLPSRIAPARIEKTRTLPPSPK